ncbi:unnamed protein product [Psylliodes chrysocephalus]|uniref:Uncharacterized protein n=1 Tax=Psylliodes chrysocephalus TaxID=3402493 RepID=A0A9P0D4L7_9CUCU|nr:unnamed protein product [Psylliodes chrysocephala]
MSNNAPNNYYNPQNMQRTPFPSQPINIQHRPIQQKFLTNEQVFGKPTNVFAPKNSHKPTGKPEPMSTSSRLPSTRNFAQNYRPQNHFQNRYANNGKLPFVFEELRGRPLILWLGRKRAYLRKLSFEIIKDLYEKIKYLLLKYFCLEFNKFLLQYSKK